VSKVKGIVALVALGVLAIVGLLLSGSMFESLDAGEIMVVQSIGGTMTWYTTPGNFKYQGLGKVTKYRLSNECQFLLAKNEEGQEVEGESIKIRFNDGGEGHVSGSVRFELPIDEAHLNLIHLKYGSQEAVERALVRTQLEKAIYMSGPMMSSTESYSARRNELIGLIMDQAKHGVYKTRAREVKEADPLSGEEKTVRRVEIVNGTDGMPERQEISPLVTFGVGLFNLAINRLPYNETVENQIKQQQAANAQVQTAIAQAKEAEQAAITAEKQGQAQAAKAKWEQEVIKAKMVTQAEQQREVARLEKEAAEFTKAQQILLGQGEAERKRLVMAADGALSQKLATYATVQKYYAEALGQYKGNLVPQFVMGGVGGNQSSALDFMQIIGMKAARELAFDPNVRQ
jgi:regulator of protease activity HflC (stomatin/prohibitin superfamily)